MMVLTAFGYGSYRVWLCGGPYFTKTLISLLFYSITLILEWLKVVFGPTQLDFAAIHSAVILIFAIVTGILFFIIDKEAGLICLPYICWLSFSIVLLYNLWILNSDGDLFANREDILSNISAKNKLVKD